MITMLFLFQKHQSHPTKGTDAHFIGSHCKSTRPQLWMWVCRLYWM